MIEEQAIVVRLRANLAEIQMQRQSACSHCELSSGCGTGAIGRMLGHRSKPILIENKLKLKPGDHILLGMPEHSFLTASLLIYGLPLGLLIAVSLTAHVLFEGSEIWVVIGAIGGFLGGLMLSARLAGEAFSGRFSPRVLRVNNEPTEWFQVIDGIS